MILAAVDNSPIAALITETAAQLASAPGRAVYVVHAQEDVTAGETAVDGEGLTAARALVTRQLDLLTAHRCRPRARSCGTPPVTAWPDGWSPSTPTPSGPARS